jgi:integrase/recombinase XerD
MDDPAKIWVEGAGIRRHITPHFMRHAFAEQMTRHGGVRQAQHMFGHSDLRTTEIYLGSPHAR